MGSRAFRADEPWSDTPGAGTSIPWAALEAGDETLADFLRFTRELIGLRRQYPALRGEGCAINHVHDQNRVLAFQRWVEGAGADVVVVCSLTKIRCTIMPSALPPRGAGVRCSTVTSTTIG